MAKFTIRRSDIQNSGISEDVGALMVGFALAPKQPFETIMFQIDTDDSDQRKELFGMYSELDDKGVYGSVRSFDLDESGRLVVGLDRAKTPSGVEEMAIEIPASFGEEGRSLLAKMVRTFAAYPRK